MDITQCRTMLNVNLYAGKKRSRPRLKRRPILLEGVKTNPSKRHRDRMNTELEKLASLLPFNENIINKLDKLSILRLSVSYLRLKNFFGVAAQKQRTLNPKPLCLTASGSNTHENYQCLPASGYNAPQSHHEVSDPVLHVPEGELLLQALNGFILVVTASGIIFYISSTVKDYLGFHQSDLINQSVFDLIHMEDREEFRRQLHWALNPGSAMTEEQKTSSNNICTNGTAFWYWPEHLPPENSCFLDRNFLCRFRCLLDMSSGFLVLNFQGKLKFLHGQNEMTERGVLLPPQLALFAIALPVQPPAIVEICTRTQLFRTRHKMDFTPMGVDSNGKMVLGWTEMELKMRSGYQFVHVEDLMYCAGNHFRMLKTGDSGATNFRLLSKHNHWIWVQAHARVVYKDGQPDYIIATQRALTDVEGEEFLQKRLMHKQFLLSSEATLYDGCSVQSSLVCAPQKIMTEKGKEESRLSPYDHGAPQVARMNQGEKEFETFSSDILTISAPNPFLNRGYYEDTQPDDIGEVMETMRQIVQFPDNSSLTTESSLDCEILEMLKKYGLCNEDMEFFQENEMEVNMNDSLFPEEMLSKVDSLALSSHPSCSTLSSGNQQHHIHSCKSDATQNKRSGSVQARRLKWNCKQEVSENSTGLHGQFLGQESNKHENQCFSLDFSQLPEQQDYQYMSSCMFRPQTLLDQQSFGVINADKHWHTPCRTGQDSTLKRQPLPSDTSSIHCSSWGLQFMPEQSGVPVVGLMSPAVTSAPLLNEQAILNSGDIKEQKQFMYQTSWAHVNSSSGIIKPCLSVSNGNPQESESSSTFLSTGVRTLLSPDYGHNLCQHFSWGSVQ
ncbi:aryl hydrocarbon receptor-like [Protopterus annectens]|uniref:aryl hydrocarbon receptor-like n=1 Tax=Protopterus annectens TaxID=7888 RepID=UPI001CFA1FE8|nr:aryl hydrocarbon receptor-like [Protopterus annectens]